MSARKLFDTRATDSHLIVDLCLLFFKKDLPQHLLPSPVSASPDDDSVDVEAEVVIQEKRLRQIEGGGALVQDCLFEWNVDNNLNNKTIS